MELVAIIVSVMALIASGATALKQLELARHANSVPVLVELFREHRGRELATARGIVFNDLDGADLSAGMVGLPEQAREPIRDLLWFYDNLGVLVAHGVVDVRPVSGYLGGTAIYVWERLKPLIAAERRARGLAGFPDADRWQEYFEILVGRLNRYRPEDVRREVR